MSNIYNKRHKFQSNFPKQPSVTVTVPVDIFVHRIELQNTIIYFDTHKWDLQIVRLCFLR